MKEKHSWIPYSDLWTLAGVVAIKEMGGPDIEWKGGRTDFVDDSRLPPRLVPYKDFITDTRADVELSEEDFQMELKLPSISVVRWQWP